MTSTTSKISRFESDVDYETDRYLEKLEDLRGRHNMDENEVVAVLNQRVGDIGDAYFDWCEEGANDADLPPSAA